MDKLLDKVGPGCPRGRREQQVSHPVDPGWELRVMSPAGGQAGQGPSPVPSLDAFSPFFSDLRTGRKPANTEEFQFYLTGIIP